MSRIEFDPRAPPPDIPSGGLEGRAICRNVFEIEAAIASSLDALSPTSVRAYPMRVDVKTRLHVTIYTPRGAPAKLRAHEEGHRMIGEHYYGEARAAAHDAAVSLLGKPFEASGADRAEAELAVEELVLAALKDAYMQRTQARSAAANARYDAITEHGLAPNGVEAAVAAAIASDP